MATEELATMEWCLNRLIRQFKEKKKKKKNMKEKANFPVLKIYMSW